MYKLAFLAFLICLSPFAGQAGPWARGDGKIFASSSIFLKWPNGRDFDRPDVYGAAYVEYGVSGRITLGIDAGSPDYMDTSRTKAIGFLRYTLTPSDARHQFAVDLGAGVDNGDALARIGLSYGTGWTLGTLSGWVTLDGFGLHAPQTDVTKAAADLTVGVTAQNMKYMVQLSASQTNAGQQTAAIKPSVVRKINKSTYVELGAVFGLINKPDPELKIGIWKEF